MRILIVGSNKHMPENSDKRKDFERACRSIGKTLAESKVEIVVGSDRETSADRYIVEGVANAHIDSKGKGGGLPTVWISRPESGPTPFD